MAARVEADFRSLIFSPNPFPYRNLNEGVCLDRPRLTKEHREIAQLFYSPDKVDLKTRTAAVEQNFVTLDPKELTSGIKSVLGLPKGFRLKGKHVDVVCAYTGRFAKSLQDAGLQVRASDILADWTKRHKRKGIESHPWPAFMVPRYPGGRLATFTFEAEDIIDSKAAYLTMLREAVGTQKGLVYVESREGFSYGSIHDLDYIKRHPVRMGFGEPGSTPAANAYGLFASLYGCGIRIVDTPHLRFYAHVLPDPSLRQGLRTDLSMLYQLRNLIPQGQSNEIPVKFSPTEVAKKYGVTETEVVISINRVSDAVFLYGSVFNRLSESAFGWASLVPEKPEEQQYFQHRRTPSGEIINPRLIERIRTFLKR